MKIINERVGIAIGELALLIPLLAALLLPMSVQGGGFCKDVLEYEVYRASATEDSEGATERAVLDAFKEVLASKSDFLTYEFNVNRGRPPDLQSRVVISIMGQKVLTKLYEAATKRVEQLKTPCPVRLVKIKRTKKGVSSEEDEQHLDYDSWQKEWRKSMDGLSKRIRKTVDERMYDAFRRSRDLNSGYGYGYDTYEDEADGYAAATEVETEVEIEEGEATSGEDENEDPSIAPTKPDRPTRRTRKKRPKRLARVPRKRRPRLYERLQQRRLKGPDISPRCGELTMLVDKDKAKVTKLLAHEVELGVILTELAGRLPVRYVLEAGGLCHRRVSLSVGDCTLDEVMDWLGAAAGAKVSRKAGVALFTTK